MFENTVSGNIRTLEDVISYSKWAEPSIIILRSEMDCDPSHDESHIVRVVRNALWFGHEGDPDIIVPAALLHDLVNVPKYDPRRAQVSVLSANKACELLNKAFGWKDSYGYQEEAIAHAIQAHSWSADIVPETIEAKAVQDADRLDALGYLGLARLFSVGGSLKRALFHPSDPLAIKRDLDENSYTLDHFYTKLIHLQSTMKTPMGKRIAKYKTQKMLDFIGELNREIGV